MHITWNRNLAMNMKTTRCLGGCALLRVAAEQRPPSGFAEQAVRGACIGLAGSTLGDANGMADSVTDQLVASLLQSLSELDTTVGNSFSEMLELSVQGIGREYSTFLARCRL